jgi:hypothetical protein
MPIVTGYYLLKSVCYVYNTRLFRDTEIAHAETFRAGLYLQIRDSSPI